VFLGEPEVGDDGVSFVHEDVGEFEVSMKESSFAHFDESTDDIFEDFEGLRFGHSAFFFYEFAEISLITELSDDVTVGRFANNIEAFEDVGMIEGGEGLDFAVEHFAADGIFDAFHIDGLDGDGLV
jgi:hypothetical protein